MNKRKPHNTNYELPIFKSIFPGRTTSIFLKSEQKKYKNHTGSTEEPVYSEPTLSDMGISKKLSSRAQKMAAIPEKEYEELAMIPPKRDKQSSRKGTSLLSLPEGSH